MPGLIEILHPKRMRVSVLNMMPIFTPRFLGIHIFPRLIIAPGTPPLIVMLISVLMLFIPSLNSVMVFLLISFASSPHLFYVLLQFPNMLSLFLHHWDNIFEWGLVPGSSFNLRCQRIPRLLHWSQVSIVSGSSIRGGFWRNMSIHSLMLWWLSVTQMTVTRHNFSMLIGMLRRGYQIMEMDPPNRDENSFDRYVRWCLVVVPARTPMIKLVRVRSISSLV